MKYVLKDYQIDAVGTVLQRLARARRDTQEYNDIVAFALSATTGAGKTVMATAVIEALFFGAEEFEAEPDPTAVVLWVTDDPSLNEQTRHRFIDAGDRLEVGQLQIIEEGFQQEAFTPGNVYFLNVQKLNSTTNYVKRSDVRDWTLWETIANTIERDDRTLYLVLDEAHRGMRSTGASTENRNRMTTVQRLINGHDGIPPVPIVWGISATVELFLAAMRAAHSEGRTTYPAVAVDPRAVQDSGLLKDVIWLDVPDEAGAFDTVLLRAAVRDIRESTARWAEYANREALTNAVVPLMVLQVGNKPSAADLARYLDVIATEWPDLSSDAIANVFGEHTDLDINAWTIPYIAPQHVQEATHVRVLMAKDAVSTGWDCPRAEVLVSFRPATDRTHITQLLGRMVRTPLARRVESDERLNSVSCFLPFFNRATVTQVAQVLTGEMVDPGDPDSGSANGTGRKVLTSPVTLTWNAAVPSEVGKALVTLPSETTPRGAVKPIKRLLTLATAIALDGLMESPNQQSSQRLYAVLDGQMAEHEYQVDQGVQEILDADIRRYGARIGEGQLLESTRRERADERTVDDAYRVATRALGAAVGNGYLKRLVTTDDDDEFDTQTARARMAALFRLEGVKAAVERAAEEMTRTWLGQLRVDIKGLSEERRAVYDEITRQDREPQLTGIELPGTRMENSRDGSGTLLETRDRHLLSGLDGMYPVGTLNDWELKVVDTELARAGCVGWYRNPSKATSDALQIPYRLGDAWKPMQPDFLFFSRRQDGSLATSIVDPHGDYLADALPKLRGFARFAGRYGDKFLRIEAVAKVDGVLQMLDLNDPQILRAIDQAENASELYRGVLSKPY